MKNTPKNLQLLNRLAQLCECTPYCIRVRKYDDGTIDILSDIRDGAPKFTPDLAVDISLYDDDSFRIRVRHWGYGYMPVEYAHEILQRLHIAQCLAETLRYEIERAGYTVEPAR